MAEYALSNRATGAWSEIASRIQARQLASVQFAILTWAVLAFTLTSSANFPKLKLLSALMLPVLGLIFSFWICHNEIIIGLLGRFCRACEEYHNKSNPSETKSIPSWFSSTQGWMDGAFRARILSDYAFILIVISTTVPSLYFHFNDLYKDGLLSSVMLWIPLIMGILSIMLILTNNSRRNRIARLNIIEEPVNGFQIEKFGWFK